MLQRIILPILLLLIHRPHITSSHGFLTTPRSRNYVAYADRIYYPQAPSDPYPEDCPSCLNRGGTLARCGIIGERNYDLPQNVFGDPMMPNVQSVYVENSQINVTVTLTAHHKGHFVFKGCVIEDTMTIPTQECFDSHPLKFVQDLYYNAPVDVNHPERVYVAPSTVSNRVYPTEKEFKDGMLFKFTLELPQGLVGELVLLQWYYVASNSGCNHEGYDVYPFPREWIYASLDEEEEESSAWEEKWSVGTGLKSCKDVLPEDGDGVPEQFWNCAEITIEPRSLSGDDSKLSTLAGSSNPNNGHSKAILGYFASWQWYDRDKLASPANMDFSKVTRVNFAFFQTNEQGDIWGTDSWADPNLLFGPYNWNPTENETEYCSWDTPTAKVCKTHFYEEGLIHLVHAAGAEIYPSLGGWSLSDPFPAMAKNEESRLNFANNCIKLVEEMDFDGIDIDWEYPGYVDHSGTPDDTESYNLLLQVLREKLDELGARNNKFYGLTAALPCGPSNINNIDIETASKYLTELNLMTYDFFGAWSPTTGVNAPLYDQDWGGEGAKDFSVDGCVRNWMKGGGSPSKINIGLPFYGRSFKKATALNETHEGNDKDTWFVDDGCPQYFNILEKLPGMISVRNEVTMTQYAYHNTTMGGLVSYDDEEAICDKTEYCIENNLHGFIIWELSGDVMRDLSTPLLDAVHRKLKDPSLSCSEEFGFGSPTFTGYGVGPTTINSTVNTPAQAPSSTTSSPTIPLSCPDGFTGSMPYDICYSFYTCVYGNPTYPITTCPNGTLFDESSSLCLPASTVTCTLTSSPSASPSRAPTIAPTVYSEPDTSKGSITGIAGVPPSTLSAIPTSRATALSPAFNAILPQEDSVEENDLPLSDNEASKEEEYSSSIPTSKVTTVSPVFNVFLPQEESAEEIELPSSSNDDSVQTAEVQETEEEDSSYLCPDNFSGARPYNECGEYYYCLSGQPKFPSIKCAPGTVFLEPMSFDVMIACAPIAESPQRCSIGPALDAFEAGGNSDSDVDETSPEAIDNEADKSNSTGIQGDPIEEPVVESVEDQSPCKACPANFTGYHASTTDCITYCLCENGVLSRVLYACPSDWMFDDEQGRCLPSDQATCSSDVLNSSEEDEEIIYVPLDDGSNAPEEEQNQKHEPPSFSFDVPFLTIEIKLSDEQSGIGWAVLSSDGGVNVAKPPGDYKDYKPKTTVYEAVPISQPREDRREMKGSNKPQRQLTVTISNTFGNGLCCLGEKTGHYKLYNGNPTPSNLLVSGGEFDYYDVILLVIDGSGVLHESNEYFASLGNAGAPPAVSPDADNETNDAVQVLDDTESSFIEADIESLELPNEVMKGNQSDSDSNAQDFSDWQQQQQHEEEHEEQYGANKTNSFQGSTADNIKPITTSDSSPEAPQQQQLQQAEEEEGETPSSVQYGDLNFDYTSNFRNDMKPTVNDEKSPIKPILISVICGSILIGMVMIFVANRRKSSRDLAYWDDESICSEDFIEHANMDVETSYRVRPVRRRESSPSKYNSNEVRRGSVDNDQSIKSGHSTRSNRSSKSNRSVQFNNPPRHLSSDDDHSIKSGQSARSNTSGRSSHSGRSSRSELNSRRAPGMSSAGSISRRNSDYSGNTLGAGSTSSQSYRRSKSYPDENSNNADGYSNDNNAAFDDVSQGVDTIVQFALNDAIPLFDDVDMRHGLNHTLEKFDEEIHEDKELT